MKKKFKLNNSQRMLIGMALGLVVGFLVGPKIAVIKPFGTLFINLLKMIMVPIVMVSIIMSIAKLADIKKFGRIAIKTFLTYCVTTVIAACISLFFVSIIKPGLGFNDFEGAVSREVTNVSVVDTLMSIVPTNIVTAMSNAHLLSIIFFSIMMGIGLSLIGEKKKPVVDFLDSLQEAIIKMVHIILLYAPFGVFCLMASIAGTYGSKIFSTLGKFILTDYCGFITQFILVYGIMMMICKIPFLKFVSRAKDALISAFTTTSSAATVPIELQQSESHYGVPKEVGGFAFPFGSTINQNGTAINITCCVLFSAQVYGFQFTPAQLVVLIFTALISSIGCSGIPGGGTVFTLAILAQYGIPAEAFGMIIACYTLVDMGSTTMNIGGDIASAIFVSKSEKILIEEVWAKDYVIPADAE